MICELGLHGVGRWNLIAKDSAAELCDPAARVPGEPRVRVLPGRAGERQSGAAERHHCAVQPVLPVQPAAGPRPTACVIP